jgi:oligopeptide transport system substrate-binding protein
MRLLAPFIALLILLLAAVSWDRTTREADLVIVNRGEVFTLDPQRMSYMQDFRMAYALYESLVRCNNAYGSIEPAAAALPEVSADSLIYTFRIRPDARWSNGDPVTAHDFIYSWSRLLWPDTAADYSSLFFDIAGAEEFFAWRSKQLAELNSVDAQSSSHERAKASLAAYAQAAQQFEQTVGLQALDDRTLQVTLKRPVPYFLDLLCFGPAYPVHRPTVEGWPGASTLIDSQRGWIAAPEPDWSQREFLQLDPASGRLQQKHEWARPGRLVSNGPYALAQWRYKRDLRLERNPYYHSPQIMRNNSVLIMSIDDANTAVLAFESGKIDWLADVGVEYQADMLEQRYAYETRHRREIDAMLAQGMALDHVLGSLPAPGAGERRDIHAFPTFGVDFLSFNCRPKLADGRDNPFADARVRRAFALAVDKHAIVQRVTRLNEPAIDALIPPDSIAGYRSPAGLSMDRPRAVRELQDAGWRDRDGDGLIENAHGDRFPVIDLLYTVNSPRYKWMCLELRAQWQQALGVHVQPRGVDTKFFSEDLVHGKFMIARGRWYGDYGDPTTFLDISRTGNGNNDRAFSDPRFDALLDEAAGETDPAARMNILRQAERLLVEEQMPILPICQLAQVYMYEPGPRGLRGLTGHPRLMQYLWQMHRDLGDAR